MQECTMNITQPIIYLLFIYKDNCQDMSHR